MFCQLTKADRCWQSNMGVKRHFLRFDVDNSSAMSDANVQEETKLYIWSSIISQMSLLGFERGLRKQLGPSKTRSAILKLQKLLRN